MINEPKLNKLISKLSKVKLLALDVDGVLTDGGLYYFEAGGEAKKFNVKDGMGIKLVAEAGIEIAIITNSTSSTVTSRAKKLGISNCFLGVEDKLSVLTNLCEMLNVSLDEVAYIGDDVNDLGVLCAVGCPITVADSLASIKENVIFVTERNGGDGAVREICDYLLTALEDE